MMECRKIDELDIILIFYDVDPSDVKLESEVHRDPLTLHEEKCGVDIVQRLAEALKEVTATTGWDTKNTGQLRHSSSLPRPLQRHAKVLMIVETAVALSPWLVAAQHDVATGPRLHRLCRRRHHPCAGAGAGADPRASYEQRPNQDRHLQETAPPRLLCRLRDRRRAARGGPSRRWPRRSSPPRPRARPASRPPHPGRRRGHGDVKDGGARRATFRK